MSMSFVYYNPTTPAGPGWSEDLGTEAVRLGSIAPGFVQSANLGEVGICNIVIDDPDGTVGHDGDAILGLKQMAVYEGAHPLGYYFVGARHYHRGDDSLRTGAARKIDVTLIDANYLLTRRIITGSDGNRPAETVNARIAWLMGSNYLDFLSDGGLIGSSTKSLEKTDFRGQTPNDVIGAMAVELQWNYWVYYDEAVSDFCLAFFDDDGSTTYACALALSNVLSDLSSTTLAASVELTRDPERCYAGVYLPYDGGAIYEYDYDISYKYGFRDGTAPNTSVKTAAKATAIALKFLEQSATEDDRLSATVRVPATDAYHFKAGMAIQVRATHLPGYEAARWCRMTRVTIGQDEMTDAQYTVSLELVPIRKYWDAPAFQGFLAATNSATHTPVYVYDADTPPAGWYREPTVADIFTPLVDGEGHFYGVRATQGCVVRVEASANFSYVAEGDQTVTFSVLRNGSAVGSDVYFSTGPLRGCLATLTVDVGDVSVAPGDEITVAGARADGGDPFWNSGADINSRLFRIGRGTFTWNSGLVVWTGP